MTDLDNADARIATWLQPLDDAAAPCGPDLEYDNAFLELTQAAAGKPESEIGESKRAAEPPDWPRVAELSEELLDRSRDLRIATFWLRAGLHLHGWRALAPGLRLVNGLLRDLWDGVHPLPDPDDGDPYGRVNALTVLRDHNGLLADLRAARVVRDRAVGELDGRAVELAAGIAEPLSSETVPPLDPQRLMVAAAVERQPALRADALEALTLVGELTKLAQERLPGDAPDFKPLLLLVRAVAALMPAEAVAGEDGADEDGGDAGEDGAPSRGGKRGLSGSVNSREEALRAIDLVCEYLERAEPTNPATLFLRRARHLVNHNFLQLMKELAPDALPEVARIVGVDPDTVETPQNP
ncbi:MAG: type VI secretion system protein TssA [Rubrivivax sp.]|nr:type VI secretion system protein TssA [Rubrivivax sp.]